MLGVLEYSHPFWHGSKNSVCTDLATTLGVNPLVIRFRTLKSESVPLSGYTLTEIDLQGDPCWDWKKFVIWRCKEIFLYG